MAQFVGRNSLRAVAKHGHGIRQIIEERCEDSYVNVSRLSSNSQGHQVKLAINVARTACDRIQVGGRLPLGPHSNTAVSLVSPNSSGAVYGRLP